MSDYIVLGSERRVDAWSNRRLPFEPRGSALEFRTTLREAMAGLTPKGILRCVHASADRTFCDTENVLLYNVGMSAFRRLVEAGLVFERSFDVPTPPTEQPFAHHHSYAMSDGDAPEYWVTPRVVSSWRATVPARPSSAACWWFAVSSAVPTTEGGLEAQPFGLRLRVAAAAVSIQSALKAMLDGTIAALHSDPTPSSLAVERVARTSELPRWSSSRCWPGLVRSALAMRSYARTATVSSGTPQTTSVSRAQSWSILAFNQGSSLENSWRLLLCRCEERGHRCRDISHGVP